MKSGAFRDNVRSAALVGRAPVLLVGAALLINTSFAAGQVMLREGRGELAGKVAEVGPQGVGVDVQIDGRPARKTVGWDRVKAVAGERAAAAEPFAALSDALWRARARLERGDWIAAEPLLAPLADRYAGDAGKGPSAAMVFDGLLRCRLGRGARSGSIGAWLQLLAVYQRSGVSGVSWEPPAGWVGGTIDALPVLDLRTGLAPALPPIWVGEPGLEVAASQDDWARGVGAGSPIAAELAAWYTIAGRYEAGSSVEWPQTWSDAAGPRLVRLIVQARTGDAAQRETARESILSIMARDGIEAWEEAWCRAALGRSLLRESDREQKIRGVVQLLHVPARLSRSSPYLSGVCMAEAATAMWDLGDPQAAGALKQELAAAYPTHPALTWSRLLDIKPGTKPPGPAAPPPPEKNGVPEAAALRGGGP